MILSSAIAAGLSLCALKSAQYALNVSPRASDNVGRKSTTRHSLLNVALQAKIALLQRNPKEVSKPVVMNVMARRALHALQTVDPHELDSRSSSDAGRECIRIAIFRRKRRRVLDADGMIIRKISPQIGLSRNDDARASSPAVVVNGGDTIVAAQAKFAGSLRLSSSALVHDEGLAGLGVIPQHVVFAGE